MFSKCGVWPSSATAAAFRSVVSDNFQRQGNADDAAPGDGRTPTKCFVDFENTPRSWFAWFSSVKVLPFRLRPEISRDQLCVLASLQCYLTTSFLSEKIFYHGWTRIHTDRKEGSTRLDPNCANYRQLNSRQFAKFASRPCPCLFVSLRG